MTAHVGTMSVDGTPISQADMARIEAEEVLHATQQRRAVHVIASAATDAEDARTLLAMLGLGPQVVAAARADLMAPAVVSGAPAKRARKRRAA